MKTRRQIDASRERRLWVTQVVMPSILLAFVIPEVRTAVKKKYEDVKWWIKDRFNK